MRHFQTSLLILVLGLFISIDGLSQIYKENSPYSYFGIGTMHPSQQALNRSMGGLSIPYRSPVHINPDNPASYSGIRFATLETAFFGNGLWLRNADTTHRTGTSSISYLNLGFPVGKKGGMSIGLSPYSSINYDILDEGVLTDTEGNEVVEQYNFIGTGEVYQVYAGGAYQVFRFSGDSIRTKSLNVGFNFGYLFGNYDRRVISYLPQDSYDFGNRSVEQQSIGGFHWKLGLIYTQQITDKTYLIGGATATTQTSLNTETNSFLFRRNQFGVSIDTVSATLATEGKIKLPSSLGFGLAIQRPSHWLAGFDIKMTNWQNYSTNEVTDDLLINSIRYSVGVGVTPQPNAIRGFFQKTNYRFGAYYDSGYLQINDTNITEFGLTFGVGLPLRPIPKTNLYSKLNLSFELGQKGTFTNDLLRESFFKFNIGVNVNDIWFIKRKFD